MEALLKEKRGRITEFMRKNKVLIRFYLMLIYCWLLFYFMLHWPVSRKYLAVALPTLIARVIAAILTFIGFPSHSVASGIVMHEGFSYSIIYECAGIFGVMIFVAAVIAYPSKWTEKLWGLLIGVPGLFLINTIRMAALGVIGLKWRSMFDWFHEWMWQGIFIVFVIFFWLLWKEKFVKSDKLAEVSG